MQVLKINSLPCEKTYSIKKISNNSTVFRGYRDTMAKAVVQDLREVTEVSSVFGELINSLKAIKGVRISPEMLILENNGFRSIGSFMEKISAPIAKVPSALRDLVFKAEDTSITLLEKEGEGSLTMYNFGKKGFLNSIFNSQDARSDIKFVFDTPNYDTFEVGVTKKGGLVVEQTDYPNWKKSKFGILNRSSCESGTIDTTPPIWPSI